MINKENIGKEGTNEMMIMRRKKNTQVKKRKKI